MRGNSIIGIVGILFTLYLMQGFLYPSGSIISQSILLILLIIGLVCFIGALLQKQLPLPVAIFALFYVLLAFTFIISPKVVFGWKYEAIGAVNTFGQFKNISVFSLLFFLGYYITLKYNVTWKTISSVGIMFLLSSIIMFFYTKANLILEYKRENITNNGAYLLVSIIPFIPIFFQEVRNKIWRILLLAAIVIIIILGSKRGAIACMMSCGVFSAYYYMKRT